MKRLALVLGVCFAACRHGHSGEPSEVQPSGSAGLATAASAATPLPRSTSLPPRSLEEFRELVTTLSEQGAPFFEDNYVSNETSYLQVAPGLAAHSAPGGVYLGVGPEQNFSYIALTQPSDAFIVDIRRDNLILHLLYKAAFDLASNRAEFLTLLLGRSYDATSAFASDSSVQAVMARAERSLPSEADFKNVHARLRDRIEHGYGIALGAEDQAALERTHRAFYVQGLDLQFNSNERDVRPYPRLRELLALRDRAGSTGGFLASEPAFRFVQRLQRRNRIVPVVGDFGGERALAGIARRIAERGETLSVFYVSNVEQYLFAHDKWARFVANVQRMPIDEHSLFLRAYLDQGRPHPLQWPRHQTASVLQKVSELEQRQAGKPYASFWEVATDCLPEPSSSVATPPPAAPDASDPSSDEPGCANAPDAMACVPAGPFTRGVEHDGHHCDQPGQTEDGASTTPAMRIWLDTFFIDRTEVTNEAYARCATRGRCAELPARYPGFDAPELPVTGASWYAADSVLSLRRQALTHGGRVGEGGARSRRRE